MHEVLVNRLGGLSLPRKSVVRLTDRPDMTLYIYRGRKTTIIITTTTTIGVGRFRILGGQGLEYWGGARGGANSQQSHDVVMTSMRRKDVASTSFRRHVPNRFLINQCQIIAFLILKASTKFRIERNSFASTFKSN